MVMPMAAPGAPIKQSMPSRDIAVIIIAGVLLLGGLALPAAWGVSEWFDEILWQLDNDDPWIFFHILALLSPLGLGATIAFTVFREYVFAAFFAIPLALKWIVFQATTFGEYGFDDIAETLPLTSLITFIQNVQDFDSLGIVVYLFVFNLEPIGAVALAFLLLSKRASTQPNLVVTPQEASAVPVPTRPPVASRIALALAFFVPVAAIVIGFVTRQDLRRRHPGADVGMATGAIVASVIVLTMFTALAISLVLEG